jgi:hypothetical protein
LPVLLNALPTKLDKAFRESLKAKMKFLNEFSLRRRIAELVRKHSKHLDQWLGSEQEFATRIADLRNKLTHLSEDTAEDPSDYKKLWRASCQMSLLFEVCLLHELCFDDQLISKMLSHRSSSVRRLHYSTV